MVSWEEGEIIAFDGSACGCAGGIWRDASDAGFCEAGGGVSSSMVVSYD